MRDLDQIHQVVEQAGEVYDSGNLLGALNLLTEIHFEEQQKSTAIYARFLCVRGSAEAELGQLDRAIKTFAEALEYYQRRTEHSGMGLIHFNLGNVYKYASQPQEAQHNYEKAIEQFKNANDSLMAGLVCLSLGTLLGDSGDWEDVRKWFNQADGLLPDANDLQPAVLWSKHSMQANLAVFDRDDKLAIEFRRQAIEAAARAGIPMFEAESLLSLAKMLARAGDIHAARGHALRGRQLLATLPHPRAKNLRRATQAALIKIDNLALAFGAAPDSQPEQLRAEMPATVTSSYQQEFSESEMAMPLIAVARNVGFEKDEFISNINSICGEGVGYLCVLSHTNAFVSLLDTPESVVLDVHEPSTWNGIEKAAASVPGANALRSVAPKLCQIGVDLKSEGQFEAALLHYSLALRLAILCRLVEGLHVVTGNLFILAKQIVTQIKYASELLMNEVDQSEMALDLGGGALVLKRRPRDNESYVNRLLEFSRAEALQALLSIEKIEHWVTTTDDPKLRLLLLRSFRRLESLSGRRASHQSLEEICKLCEANRNLSFALESIYEELADTDFFNLLAYAGTLKSQASSETDRDEKALVDFQSTWELYLKWRSHIGRIDSPTVGSAARLSLDNFEVLRSHAVAGGGAFGHGVSYETAQFSARISRDLIWMLIKGEREQQLDALSLAERTCSRALVDWMARTHANDRLVVRLGVRGSAGEVQCASIEEIFSAAEKTNTAILYYVAISDGYVMWVVYPDGDWDCIHLQQIAPEIRKLFQTLPYTFGAVGLGKARSNTTAIANEKKKLPIDPLLLKVGESLFPESVIAKLEAKSPRQIAIIADQMMQFIPFACLRLNGSSFLIDQFDIVYWPSVTAWLLCSQAESLYKCEEPMDSLVMGGPDFSSKFLIKYRGIHQHIKLEDLPGARQEALNIADTLGTQALTQTQARFSAVLDHYFEQRNESPKPRWSVVPVLHLATHGLTDTWDANQSFIAFADQVVTADSLYSFDPGLRTRLVMLSCCQTAVGYTHPDSILGLTNAFLVAGACTVGSTLWNIDDSATLTLMSHFYQELKRGEDVSAALRKAQNHLRSFPEWWHPFYWAPFKLSGSFSNPVDPNTRKGVQDPF